MYNSNPSLDTPSVDTTPEAKHDYSVSVATTGSSSIEMYGMRHRVSAAGSRDENDEDDDNQQSVPPLEKTIALPIGPNIDIILDRVFKVLGIAVFVFIIIMMIYISVVYKSDVDYMLNQGKNTMAKLEARLDPYLLQMDAMFFVMGGITGPDPTLTKTHLQQFMDGAISSNLTYTLSNVMMQVGQGNVTASVVNFNRMVSNVNKVTDSWIDNEKISIEIPV
jgi:hypothetical protein